MTYEIVEEPHTCALPSPGDFAYGTMIRCTEPRLRNGRISRCGAGYYRDTKFWDKTPLWKAEWHYV